MTRELKPGDLFLQRGVFLEILRVEDSRVVYRCRNFRKGYSGEERRSPLNMFLAMIDEGKILPAGRLVSSMEGS